MAVGRRFSSEQTLAQANQTLLALDQHAKTLAGFGFALADATRLKDARALLIEAGVVEGFSRVLAGMPRPVPAAILDEMAADFADAYLTHGFRAAPTGSARPESRLATKA